jgi:thiamine-monophosphate kinase
MSGKGKRSGEFELIAKYFAPLAAGEPGALVLKDDAACLKPRAGCDLVLTTDAIVAGVHFFAHDPPQTVAKKALRVNLSDLAAKGAVPRGYLLTLALPADIDEAWVKGFAKGLKSDQATFGIALLGGDTTGTPGPLTINIAAFGEVPSGKMIARGDAKVGDDVWVSGTIGDAALGLRLLKGETYDIGEKLKRAALQRFRVPKPRSQLGPQLIGVAHACIDVSDGLIADLGHICEVSAVGMEIVLRDVPLSAAAKAAVGAGTDAAAFLSGGDDYELALTASPSAHARLAAVAAQSKVPLTRIGQVVKGKAVRVLDATGKPLRFARAGYTHF